jgi:hypothetical protein
VERTYEVLVYAHEGTVVLELSTVVGSCEDGHKFTIPHKFVTFFYHLMSSTNQVNIKFGKIIYDHILSKSIAYVSLVFSPTSDFWVGIRPKDIAQHSFLRYLDGSLDVCELVEILEIR